MCRKKYPTSIPSHLITPPHWFILTLWLETCPKSTRGKNGHIVVIELFKLSFPVNILVICLIKKNSSQIWYDFCIFSYYFFALPLLRIWIMSLTAEDTGKEMINIFVVNIKYHIWKNWYSTKCIEITNVSLTFGLMKLKVYLYSNFRMRASCLLYWQHDLFF